MHKARGILGYTLPKPGNASLESFFPTITRAFALSPNKNRGVLYTTELKPQFPGEYLYRVNSAFMMPPIKIKERIYCSPEMAEELIPL